MDLKDELDPGFTRRQWAVQRVGWVVMGLIVLAALAGLFGASPLASAVETREADGVRYEVEHPRFTRYQSTERLHVRVHAPGASGDELKLAFSNGFVENNLLAGSAPEADGGGSDRDGAFYTYKVEDWSEPIVVVFEYEPRKAFRSPGTLSISVGDGEPVRLPLDSFVYP